MQDVVEEAQVIEQGEVLEDETDVANAEQSSLPVAQPVDLVVLHANRARPARNDPGDQMQQRGLPAAARPNQRGALSFLHGQAID